MYILQEIDFFKKLLIDTVWMSQLLSLDFDADKTFDVQLIKPDKLI